MSDRETIEVSQDDIETAKERLTRAMGALKENRMNAELELQHAHAALGGEKDELYREYDND